MGVILVGKKKKVRERGRRRFCWEAVAFSPPTPDWCHLSPRWLMWLQATWFLSYLLRAPAKGWFDQYVIHSAAWIPCSLLILSPFSFSISILTPATFIQLQLNRSRSSLDCRGNTQDPSKSLIQTLKEPISVQWDLTLDFNNTVIESVAPASVLHFFLFRHFYCPSYIPQVYFFFDFSVSLFLFLPLPHVRSLPFAVSLVPYTVFPFFPRTLSLTFIIFANTFVFPFLPPSFPHHSWGSAVAIGDSAADPWVSYSLAGKGPVSVLPNLSLGAENSHVPISPHCFSRCPWEPLPAWATLMWRKPHCFVLGCRAQQQLAVMWSCN